jgi:asparagine synthase (glutamine-hydrolysing)
MRKGIFTEIARRLPEPSSRKNILRRFKRFVMAQNLEPKRRYATWLTMMDNPTKRRLYSKQFAERMDAYDSLDLFDETYAGGTANDTLDRILSSDVRTYLPDDLLVKVDIASMVHSLEARSPFLDHHLAEFVARLPSNFKLKGRDRKHILKRALKNTLPDSILNRGKYGFAAPVASWFRGELRSVASEVLLDSKTMSRGIFSRVGVENMLEEHTSGRVNHGDHIWELLVLELWFRTYVDRPRSALTGPAEGILPIRGTAG